MRIPLARFPRTVGRFAAFVPLTAAACSLSAGLGDGGGDGNPSPPPNGGMMPPPGGSAAPPVQTVPLAFSPSNVPAGTTASVPGEMVFGTDTCDRTTVQIDTAQGIVQGCSAMTNAFAFAKITQSDMSLGPLPAALFVTARFTIGTGMTVQVVGNLPLIVVALGDVNISGQLVATGGVAGVTLSNGPDQQGGGPGGGASKTSGNGGGGAGYCGKGGGGGMDLTGGGKSYGSATVSPLLAGSSGGSNGGMNGAGGGAVQIVSATSIQVTGPGVIHVGGKGGTWGGGGGGSGGAILLEAPTIAVAGTLAANGGAGGGGFALDNNGQDAQSSATPASGDHGGGNGAAGSTVDGAQSAGASGGGGGAGWIRLNTTAGTAMLGATAVLSPAPTTPCTTQGALAH